MEVTYMPAEIYDEGRVVGYSAYEIYVKQHLSEDPDTPVASEREWLASSLAMGTSMLLRVPSHENCDEDTHWFVDVTLPHNSILAAANTIIGSFFDGDAYFDESRVMSCSGKDCLEDSPGTGSYTFLEIADLQGACWASRVTDYGQAISNNNDLHPERGPISPREQEYEGSTIEGDPLYYKRLPSQPLADWDESKKSRLRNYMKIVDGLVLQPGVWEHRNDNILAPNSDFSADIRGNTYPTVRLHIKGKIEAGKNPLVLLTGFTIRSVLLGTVGTYSAIETQSSVNGDFLGPSVFPWANKIVFSVPTSYIVYFSSGSYKRKINPDNPNPPYNPNTTGDKDPIRVSDTPVIDMKSPSADVISGSDHINALDAPVLENYYVTGMPTDIKFYENTTSQTALPTKKKSRIPDEIHDFATLGDGTSVLTVYSKKSVYPPALYGTFVDSRDDIQTRTGSMTVIESQSVSEERTSWDITRILSLHSVNEVFFTDTKQELEGVEQYDEEIGYLIYPVTIEDEESRTYVTLKHPKYGSTLSPIFRIVTIEGLVRDVPCSFVINRPEDDRVQVVYVSQYKFRFHYDVDHDEIEIQGSSDITPKSEGGIVQSVGLIGVKYMYSGYTPISDIDFTMKYTGTVGSRESEMVEPPVPGHPEITNYLIGPVENDEQDRDKDGKRDRDYAERQWVPYHPPIQGSTITLTFEVVLKDNEDVINVVEEVVVDYNTDPEVIDGDQDVEQGGRVYTNKYFQFIRIKDVFALIPAYIYPTVKSVALKKAEYTYLEQIVIEDSQVHLSLRNNIVQEKYYNDDPDEEMIYRISFEDGVLSITKGSLCDSITVGPIKVTTYTPVSPDSKHYLHPIDVVAPGTVKMFYNDDGTAMQDYQDTFEGTTAINKTTDGTLEVLDPTSTSTNIKKISVADQDVEDLTYTNPATANSKSAQTVVTAGANKAKRTLIQTGKKQSISLSMTNDINKVTSTIEDGYKGTQITVSQKPSQGITLDDTNSNDFITWSALLAALENDQGVDILAERLRSAKNHLIENNPASGTKNGPYLEFGPNGTGTSAPIRLYICKNEPETSGVPIGSIGIGWGFDYES